jgi:hypothetical protein
MGTRPYIAGAGTGTRPYPINVVLAVTDLREAPVHDEHLAEVADHDVRGLEVAVDHAAGVSVGHPVANLEEDLKKFGKGESRREPF